MNTIDLLALRLEQIEVVVVEIIRNPPYYGVK